LGIGGERMNIGDSVRHLYNKKSSGKIVAIPDSGLCAGKIQVEWDSGPCYFHSPKFLVDPNASDEPLSSANFATVDAIEAIEPELSSDYGELGADDSGADGVEADEPKADEEAVNA
jgi:hypothetical protein